MSDIDSNDELKKLLIENLADTKILKEEIVKIKSYMRWRTVISFVWILLIILPLIAGLFFIPDILSDFSTSTDLIKTLGL